MHFNDMKYLNQNEFLERWNDLTTVYNQADPSWQPFNEGSYNMLLISKYAVLPIFAKGPKENQCVNRAWKKFIVQVIDNFRYLFTSLNFFLFFIFLQQSSY